MNYTSIEQSKKLVELGLNPMTADLCFIGSGATVDPNDDQYRLDIISYNEVLRKLELMRQSDLSDKSQFGLDDGRIKFIEDKLRRLVPSWSMSALLELMPLSIVGWDNETYTRYFIGNCAEYATGTSKYDKDLISIPSDSMFKCIYSMVKWLLENHYIK